MEGKTDDPIGLKRRCYSSDHEGTGESTRQLTYQHDLLAPKQMPTAAHHNSGGTVPPYVFVAPKLYPGLLDGL